MQLILRDERLVFRHDLAMSFGVQGETAAKQDSSKAGNVIAIYVRR